MEDAEKEAKTIILRAEAQAEKILEEAEKEAEKKYESIINENKEKLRTKEQQSIILFELEAKNRLLRAKEELIEAVYDRTLNRLREYTLTKDYMNCLLRLISEASRQISSDELTIQLNERDYQALTEKRLLDFSRKIGVKLVKSKKRIDCIGGVIAMSPDGKIVVDNTFENRLRMLKNSLRVKVAEILFQEE